MAERHADMEQGSDEPRPPVLGYRGPVEQPSARADAVKSGLFSMWFVVLLSVLMLPLVFVTFPVGTIALVIKGIREFQREGNPGFLLGVAFGVLTSVGLAMLLFIVICGR